LGRKVKANTTEMKITISIAHPKGLCSPISLNAFPDS
jgi:hypothetical protein